MNRIDTLASLTKGIDTLLDIGTDHGYLIVKALKEGFINQAIAADLNSGPLSQAMKNIKNEGLNEKVSFIKSNGFESIDQPFDGVCIAGMGMHLISEILSQPHKKADKYILQSNTRVFELRSYLSSNGFKIVDEKVVYDKHYYVIVVAIKEKESLNYEDLLLGPVLKHDKNAIKYYQKEMNKLKTILSYVDSDKKNQLIKELDILQKRVEILQIQ
ncbi:MAG: class I SAM-dependent methyltransferase [Acholeplasmataceae bacterium]